MLGLEALEELVPEGKKFCECNCGELIDVYSKWDKHPRRFKQHHASHIIKPGLGKKPGNFRGYGVAAGYEWVYLPEHHFATKGHGTVLKHRLIWEEYHKAILLPWTVVHHKNDIKTDNRIENLDAMIRYKHNFIHKPRKNMSDRKCVICGSTKGRIYKHKNGFTYTSWYKGKDGWLCGVCYKRQCRTFPSVPIK